MACYLSLSTEERGCGRCSRAVAIGLVAWGDDHVIGPRLSPLCGTCLHRLDPRLYAIWRLARQWARPMESCGNQSLVDIMESMPLEPES